MINTIIFDLGEVYLRCFSLAGENLATRLGISEEEARKQYGGEELEAFNRGDITEEEYWSSLIARHRWNISMNELKMIIRGSIKEIDGVRELIERLREQGYKLGLLSNISKEWAGHNEGKFDYHRLFDVIVYSFEVGIRKPDKEIYKIVLERLQVNPDECVFIDDREKNLIPARGLGMHTIRFEEEHQLRGRLCALGIKI